MGDDDWNEVTRKNRGYRTKEDDLAKVSMSIYVTNFPESCSAKDLFQSCKVYGHIVDSYIPLKRSKSGKRFGFVRFINVFSVERLIIRPPIHVYNSQSHSGKWNNPVRNKDKDVRKENISQSDEKMNRGMNNDVQPPSNSFVSAVKGSSTPLPAIVLDEECLVDRDLDNSVMGEVLHFSSLNNLRVLLYNEGFADVVFMLLARFLGDDYASHCLGDSEGVPLTRGLVNSFHKMGLIWGEFLKLLIIGKVFMVRAKELFVWSPSFKDVPEVIQCSDVNSFKNAAVNDIEDIPDANVEEESNCEAVSDTCFGDSEEVPVKEKENIQSVNDKEVSKDPFGIYEILNRSKVSVNPESSIPYPPGFTPEEGNETTMFVNISQEVQEEHHKSASCSSRVFEEVENSDIYVQSEGKEGRLVRKEGGSILDALDDMIKGLDSKAKKDWIRELTNKHKISFLSLQETKKEFFTDLEIKYFWGNYQFAHVESEALGLSGGILCVWDSNIFQKTPSYYLIISLLCYGKVLANLSGKGGNMYLVKSWDETIHKLKKRLSIWKLKTLSIGGRLTLLKSVLGSTPIYNLSLFKVPKSVLNKMENLRSNFFNGIQEGDHKIVWVKWIKVLAAKKFGGLGVSSFFAFNRGLIVKWVWRFISGDNSLWCKFISATHGSSHSTSNVTYPSIWKSILKEFYSLKVQETDIDISVAAKLQSIVASFWRSVRVGVEDHQLQQLVSMLHSVILSSSNDRWIYDLNGDGIFRVKDIRNLLDEFFLPKIASSRANLALRGVVSDPLSCPIYESHVEDSSHLFFNCSHTIRLGSKLKIILEGIFYVTWWSLWTYRNQYLFANKKPRKDSIFDDIALRSFLGVVDEAGAGATRGVSWDVLLKWWFLGGRGVGGVISAWSGVTTSGVVMVIRGLGQPHLIILAWSGGVSSVDGLGGMLVGWLWGGGLEAVVIMVSLLGDARKWGADAVGEWSRAWGGAGVRGVSSQSSVLMPRQAICACSRYAYFI
ncbi:RNA-directed DNA polymerase, eukaryota [Tanacetum coccineum]|uniref:RNA-directed DNA polymerase, eukaryota n=1 Tax=Tanacetum coccineum TaxID=301880 RepID=A0ABQ4YAX1_9ASTR